MSWQSYLLKGSGFPFTVSGILHSIPGWQTIVSGIAVSVNVGGGDPGCNNMKVRMYNIRYIGWNTQVLFVLLLKTIG